MKKLISVSLASALIFAILWGLKLFEVTDNLFVLALIGAALFFVGSLALKLTVPRMRIHRFFSLKRMNFLEVELTLCVSILLISGSFLLNYVTSFFYRQLSVDAPAAFSGSGYSSVGVAILCIALLPSLFEELFFRGAVLTLLRLGKIKTWAVIVFSSALFMMLHGPSWYFITDFYAGVMLSLLVYFTGSLTSSVIAHFLSNTLSFFLAIYGARLIDAGIGNLAVHVAVMCFLGAGCHLLHLLKKVILRDEAEDRSRINENSRRWEEQKKAKGEPSNGNTNEKVES